MSVAASAPVLSSVSIAPLPVAPDFDLLDHRGQSFRLSARLGARATLVVFYRGHWCPYCRRYLGKLQAQYARFCEAQAVIAAISPEPVETSRALADELGIQFTLLSDCDGRVMDRYGARNGFFTGRSVLPHPSVFVLNSEGRIRFRSIDRNYKKRTTMRTIFSNLGP